MLDETVQDTQFAAAGGFCFAISPHNLPFWGFPHGIGAGTFVATFWIIGHVRLAHLRGILQRW